MTGNELFERALDICGLKTAEYDLPTDISDLQSRALNLINLVLAESSELDCRIRKAEHEVIRIGSMSDTIPCSDIVAESVLPYGLAKLFMLGEDDVLAADLDKLYRDSRVAAIRFGKAVIAPITEVYS